MSGDYMSEDNISNNTTEPVMLEEYDFSEGVRGKYFKEMHTATNVVVLDPDVAKHFPNSSAVNHTLRVLLRIKKRNK